MKRKIFLLLVSVVLLGLSGCNQSAYGQVLQSEIPRDTSPSVDQTDSAALVDGNNAFAFDLYQALRHTDGNLFFSPYSISLALAMTYAGARSETETEMASVLHFTLPQDRLHPAFNWLDLALISRSETAKGQDSEGFRLHIANAIWGQQGHDFLGGFLDVLGQNYGAGLRLLDFVNQPESSRVTINDWVSDETEGKIKDLIPQGAITQWTRLVLTNAIYFNASWLKPFNKDLTLDGTFHLVGGGNVTVPMMAQTEYFAYIGNANYQAVELLYDGQQLSMVIFMPNDGQFDVFEESLDADLVKEIIGNLQTSRIDLTMPKFSYESSFSLKQTLNSLVMEVAFNTDADFSGMDGVYDLYIQDVFHKAFVAVDESRTEAAAASGVVGPPSATPPLPLQVTIDRPFIFLIRDIATNTTIFIGRVLNPAEE